MLDAGGATKQAQSQELQPPTIASKGSMNSARAQQPDAHTKIARISPQNPPQAIKRLASKAVKRAKTARKPQTATTTCPFGADIVTPLVGNKVGLRTLMERFPPGHARLAELEKLDSGENGNHKYRSIRGESDSALCVSHHKAFDPRTDLCLFSEALLSNNMCPVVCCSSLAACQSAAHVVLQSLSSMLHSVSLQRVAACCRCGSSSISRILHLWVSKDQQHLPHPMLYDAGDGNCLYRAVLVRLVEAAASCQDSIAVAGRLTVLYSELPNWVTTPKTEYGYQLLLVGFLTGPLNYLPADTWLSLSLDYSAVGS